MYFCVITKNLNWEILTKKLVTFKRWDEVKDEKLQGFTEKSDIYGGSSRKTNIWRGIA